MPLSYWVYFGPMVLSKYTGLGASSGFKLWVQELLRALCAVKVRV